MADSNPKLPAKVASSPPPPPHNDNTTNNSDMNISVITSNNSEESSDLLNSEAGTTCVETRDGDFSLIHPTFDYLNAHFTKPQLQDHCRNLVPTPVSIKHLEDKVEVIHKYLSTWQKVVETRLCLLEEKMSIQQPTTNPITVNQATTCHPRTPTLNTTTQQQHLRHWVGRRPSPPPPPPSPSSTRWSYLCPTTSQPLEGGERSTAQVKPDLTTPTNIPETTTPPGDSRRSHRWEASHAPLPITPTPAITTV
ncbi:hypothetical protein Pmani_002493 [Petrolisthes manimaculis]|uniref:Uncharacterized protein n=1 Tax=Petrolisthes manimaculis TaxID=1843537 RepID=A0AAE1PL77_9EUCA|nr:hypothetical protein Pmani_019061 [Petrolisthes manimaculis]KAK4327047.1 hypothetical protein Pmani_002493 [Petrolisthes manimaculis]